MSDEFRRALAEAHELLEADSASAWLEAQEIDEEDFIAAAVVIAERSLPVFVATPSVATIASVATWAMQVGYTVGRNRGTWTE